MASHRENPEQNIIAIIPARYGSTRLEAKLLREIAGKAIILQTLGRVAQSGLVSRIIAATDHPAIFETVSDAGYEAVMTSPGHPSGTDRIAEVAAGLAAGSLIVNVQADEPMISPKTIDATISALIEDEASAMATAYERILHPADVLSPDVVKIVVDHLGNALYFSRSPIPYIREEARAKGNLAEALGADKALSMKFLKHIGIYAYRREFLLAFGKLPQSGLEEYEKLEQLRALQNGYRIKAVETFERSIGIDTEEDFLKAKAIMEAIHG